MKYLTGYHNMTDDDMREYLARNPKFTLRFQTVFNRFDNRCRQMCLSNPARPMTDYCEKCQNMIKEVLGDLL